MDLLFLGGRLMWKKCPVGDADEDGSENNSIYCFDCAVCPHTKPHGGIKLECLVLGNFSVGGQHQCNTNIKF